MVSMRTRSLPLRRGRGRLWFPPPISDEAPLGSGEQGVLDLGQSLPLEPLRGLLDLIEGLQFAFELVDPLLGAGNGISFVVLEDETDVGHGTFISLIEVLLAKLTAHGSSLPRSLCHHGILDRRELYVHHLGAMPVHGWCPAQALLALRATRYLIIPIDSEGGGLKAHLLASLPLVIESSGAVEIHPVVFLAFRQKLGGQVAGVHELGFWEQFLLL